MANQRAARWQDLFGGGRPSGGGIAVKLRVIERAGRPFLVLPAQGRAASRGLGLYAAQTAKARLAKRVLAAALRWGLPAGGSVERLEINWEEVFAKFMTETAGGKGLPKFAILLGNPNTDGQRFIILLFDADERPVAVVKAGIDDKAVGLIEHEAGFLGAVAPNTPGVPRLRGTFHSGRLQALALDFFPGNTPHLDDEAGVERVLTSWVDRTRTVRMGELPVWQRLAGSGGARSPGWDACKQLEGVACRPVIQHGDFAPWNIKVPGGSWMALDWERGERTGIPGWDWFHYFVQGAVLVRRESAGALVGRVERMLASEAFRRYAERAGITGNERLLMLVYLEHCVRTLEQTEGLEAVKELAQELGTKWRGSLR